MDIRELLDHQLCIGCGACGALEYGPNIVFNQQTGLYEPENVNGGSSGIGQVCPFVGDNPSSEVIEREFYDYRIGGYNTIFAGHVLEEGERSKSTSGGLVNYFIKRLFETNEIDGVIHLKASLEGEQNLFSYGLSNSYDEASEARGTKYYPGEISAAIDLVRNKPGKYAFVGLPCYVRGLRLLMKNDAEIDSRFNVLISLVCGHQKTANYSNYLAYKSGHRYLKDIVDIDYRFPVSEHSAHLYKVKVSDRGGLSRFTPPMKEIYAEDWSMGLCMPKVCQYCDDVAGEHADITFGDAWIEPYSLDGKGTNIVIARDQKWRDLFNTKDVSVNELAVEDFVHSQAGSFRFRREGVFLRKTELTDFPTPVIRVEHVGKKGRQLLDEFEKRLQLSSALRKYERKFLSKRIPKHADYLRFFVGTYLQTKRYEIFKRGFFKSIIPARLKRFAKKILGVSSGSITRSPYEPDHRIERVQNEMPSDR